LIEYKEFINLLGRAYQNAIDRTNRAFRAARREGKSKIKMPKIPHKVVRNHRREPLLGAHRRDYVATPLVDERAGLGRQTIRPETKLV
jgi:hypothetical protein